MSIKSIFDKMTYEDLMLLADEYNFYPDNELQKDAYSKEFISFLKTKDLEGQIIARFSPTINQVPLVHSKQINLFNFQVQQKVAMIEGLDKHIVFLNASGTGVGRIWSDRRPCHDGRCVGGARWRHW